MEKAHTILFLLLTTVFYAQDKLVAVDEKMQEVFALIEKENTEELKQLSTKKMYCLLCYENAPKKDSY